MVDVLKSYYPARISLAKYLTALDDKLKESLIQQSDSKEYRFIIWNTLACTQAEHATPPAINTSQHNSFKIREIIERVIEINCSGNTENVLSLGYESIRGQGKSKSCVSNKRNIINKYPNSIVGYLNGLPWQQLHDRIGDDLMLYLLRDVSMFIKTENSCYVQISGPPVYNLQAIKHDGKHLDCSQVEKVNLVYSETTRNSVGDNGKEKKGDDGSVGRKRKRTDKSCHVNAKRFKTSTGKMYKVTRHSSSSKTKALDKTHMRKVDSSDKMFSRSYLMYSTNFAEKFPKKHILSTLSASNRGALKLIRSIFVDNTANNISNPKTGSRNGCKEAKVKPDRLPKRFVKMKAMFLQFLKYHKRCNFKALLKHHCYFADPRDGATTNQQSANVTENGTTQTQNMSMVHNSVTCQQEVTRAADVVVCQQQASFTGESVTPQVKLSITVDSMACQQKVSVVADGITCQEMMVTTEGGIMCQKGGGLAQDEKKCQRKIADVNEVTCQGEGTADGVLCPGKVTMATDDAVKCRKNANLPPGGMPCLKKARLTPTSRSSATETSLRNQSSSQSSMDKDTSGNQKGARASQVNGNSEEKKLEEYQVAAKSFTPYHQVTRFLTAVCNRVVPKAFWGSRHNKKTFLSNLNKLIRRRKAETFYLSQMMEGIRVKDCAWLSNVPPGTHPSPPESLKQLEVLQQWVYWFVRSYLMVILRSFFYITESGSPKILYFRKPVWKVIHDFGIQAVNGTVLEPLTKSEAEMTLAASSSLGFSFMRFLPKPSSVRPITNMSHRKQLSSGISTKKPASINVRLRNTFEVLKYERSRNPEDFGSALFGYDDVFKRLKDFTGQRRIRGDARALYLVRVDVSKCFDTISHSKLFDILENVLVEEEYLVRRYVVLTKGRAEPRKMFKKRVCDPLDCRTFQQFAKDSILEGHGSNAVLVDQVNYSMEDRDNLLALLREHIFNNIVKIGDTYYRQTTGIPQGSILSSLLCAYYYDDMERTYFSHIRRDSDSLLMRWVDDSLLITPHRNIAELFLTTMHAGIPEYGCYVNQEKTLTNFDAVTGDGQPVNRVNEHELLPWCGMSVDPVSLEVRMDLSRYQDGSIKYNTVSQLHFRPGNSLAFKMRYSVRPKCIPLLLSSDLNSRSTSLVNIYQTFFLAACKFICHCKELPRGRRPDSNPRFFARLIMCLPSYHRCQTESKCRKEHAQIDLGDALITWLCCHAFIRCLRKKFVFAGVVKLLRRCLRGVKNADPALPASAFKDPFPIP